MYKNLKPEEWQQRLEADQESIILDVRTEGEFNEGHLPNAKNVPDINAELGNLDPAKNYYLHCRVGGRSAIAAHVMNAKGFPNVFNLNGNLDEITIPLEK